MVSILESLYGLKNVSVSLIIFSNVTVRIQKSQTLRKCFWKTSFDLNTKSCFVRYPILKEAPKVESDCELRYVQLYNVPLSLNESSDLLHSLNLLNPSKKSTFPVLSVCLPFLNG